MSDYGAPAKMQRLHHICPELPRHARSKRLTAYRQTVDGVLRITPRRVVRIVVLSLIVGFLASPLTALPKIAFDIRVLGADLSLRWPIPPLDPRAPWELLTSVYGAREEQSFHIVDGSTSSTALYEFPENYVGGGVGMAYNRPIQAHLLQFNGLIGHNSAWIAPVFDVTGVSNDKHLTGGILTATFDRIAAIPIPFARIPFDYRIDCAMFWAPNLPGFNSANYLHANGVLRVSVQPINLRAFQFYISGKIGIDALFGEDIPPRVLASIGELKSPYFHPESEMIRGVPFGLFFGEFKTYGTVDMEARLITSANINPGFIVFLDAGYVLANLASSVVEEGSSTGATGVLPRIGFLATVNIMDVTEIGYFVSIDPTDTTGDFGIGHGLSVGARIRS